jgi:hypothetical protein
MRRTLPAPNLTAVLALSALADLLLYRIASAVFLPSQNGSMVERWAVDLARFSANLSSILALVLAVVALLYALGSDQVFPRSMRITVSTIGLFFCALAAIGVLWNLAPQYGVHLRISHGFLAFFLAFGVWHGRRSWRAKLGITLFAVPLVMQALALFQLRMSWSSPSPVAVARLAHVLTLAAMLTAPVLVAPRPRTGWRVVVTILSGVLLAAAASAALLLRFDLVQAALFYGLRIDLTGMASTPERVYSAVLIAAYASLGAAVVSCLWGPGRSRLAGWGLLLLAATGTEISSPKPALFSLCGLLALAVASATIPTSAADVPSTRHPPPIGSELQTKLDGPEAAG